MKTVELLRKYNVCPKCGSDSIGNGEGSVEVNDDTFKRTCKCSWSVDVNDPDKSLEGRQYKDDRGWTYFVRAGLGGNQFKTFYCKPGKNPHAYRNTPWRETPGEAQDDLDQLATAKGWG